LYGNHVLKAGLGRITESTPQYAILSFINGTPKGALQKNFLGFVPLNFAQGLHFHLNLIQCCLKFISNTLHEGIYHQQAILNEAPLVFGY
jgi:hypothetical protein